MFREVLKKIREKKGDSIRSLGEKTEIHFTYISNIERGARPVNKEILSKIIKVYPDKERELTQAYLEEVLPDDVAKKVLQDNKFLLEEGNDKELLNYLMADSTAENRKAVLELMILQREVEARKNGTYENRKAELEAIKREIEKL